MADVIGGALLSASVEVLFKTLASEEFQYILSAKKSLIAEPVAELKIVLCSANSLVDDAEEKQLADRSVAEWLAALSDALFEADDLLDEIRTHASSSPPRSSRRSGRVGAILSRISSSVFESDAKLGVEKILRRLKVLLGEKDLLGLREGFRKIRSFRRLTAPLVEACEVYGRDGDKDSIFTLIGIDGDDEGYGDFGSVRVSVIPIVGMGGIGKTTLAQLVYLDKRVKGHFDLRVWVTVSEDFDVLRIMKSVLEGVRSKKCETDEMFRVQVELREALMRKKFLLVLDDVWNEKHDEWDVLKSSFESGASGSKIIVTTRSQTVASVMTTGRIHSLSAVSHEDCWVLFSRYAFGGLATFSARQDLVGIGREIVRKCKGLPLAVKSVAGVLRQEQNPTSWRKVLESDIWELYERGSDILPALWLSYRSLPPHLKQCFAYCSIFPKDYAFKKEEVILLWMAVGLVQPLEGKTMEEIGDEYFQELIARSLFQRASWDVSTLYMHDLVNDLAKYVAGDFCVRLEGNYLQGIPEKVRHFSYMRTRYEAAKRFDVLYEAKKLRTFLPLKLPSFENFITEEVHFDLLPRLKCLRVFSLSHYSNVTGLPDSISNLKHLRYLDVSHTAIKALPASICTLYNLQTLNLSYCSYLTQLPSKFGRLVNLRHLFNDRTNLKEMPLQLCNLKELQTLAVFVLGKGKGASVKELRRLNNLHGTLSVLGLENIARVRDALEANFKDKKHLKELELVWNAVATKSHEEIEQLKNFQPHTNLERLTIKNYGGSKFPPWLGDPSFTNIVFLSLTGCKYACSLPPLGQLRSLRELSIMGFDRVENVGHEFCGRDSSVHPFVSLEILRFTDMLRWKTWHCLEGGNKCGSFPSLRALCVESCPMLTGDFPHQLPQLAELEIIGCPQLAVSIHKAPALYQLDLVKCDKILLTPLPSELHWLTISHMGTIESLPNTIGDSLEELNISNCPSLSCLLKSGGIPLRLKALGISGCLKLNLEFPMSCNYEFLQSLSISKSCSSLKSFPLHLFPSLNRLHIEGCENLESLSFSEENSTALTSLNFLQISECPNFLSFVMGGLRALNLSWLCIEKCVKLNHLPEEMMYSLHILYLSHCQSLVSFPEEQLLSNLSSLTISYCEKVLASEKKWNLQKLVSLRYFSISGNYETLESFPPEGFLPPTLTSLYISGFVNLKSLDQKGIWHLKSLIELKIQDCPKLWSIPEDVFPSSLRSIQISNCLKKEKWKGKVKIDWTKIAQNACIQIDDKVIWQAKE